MGESPAKTVAVKFSDILDVFDYVSMGSDEAKAYVNRDTGVVLMNGSDGFMDEDGGSYQTTRRISIIT